MPTQPRAACTPRSNENFISAAARRVSLATAARTRAATWPRRPPAPPPCRVLPSPDRPTMTSDASPGARSPPRRVQPPHGRPPAQAPGGATTPSPPAPAPGPKSGPELIRPPVPPLPRAATAVGPPSPPPGPTARPPAPPSGPATRPPPLKVKIFFIQELSHIVEQFRNLCI
jgi:hypothetical protein